MDLRKWKFTLPDGSIYSILSIKSILSQRTITWPDGEQYSRDWKMENVSNRTYNFLTMTFTLVNLLMQKMAKESLHMVILSLGVTFTRVNGRMTKEMV